MLRQGIWSTMHWTRRRVMRWWLCAASGVLVGGAVSAQLRLLAPPPANSAEAVNLALPVNPDMTSALSDAENAIASEDWDRAIQILQLILDAEEDAFVSVVDPRSVQMRADELVASLPAAARQQYERLYTPAAEALLAQSVDGRTAQPLLELVRRYLHTPPGRQGAWRLAALRIDQGFPLSAALLLEALAGDPAAAGELGPELRIRAAAAWAAAGEDARAESHIHALVESGARSVKIEQHVIDLAADANPIERIRELVGRMGAESAHQEAQPVPPFLPPAGPPEWTAASLCTNDLLAQYPDRARQLNSALAELERKQFEAAEESGRVLIPAARPQFAGGRLIYRGPDRLNAVSLDDGSTLWISTPVDFSYRELTEKIEFATRDDLTRELYFGQRAWRDEISASIATDGVNVYTIMDCGMLGATDPGNPFQTARFGKGAFRDNTLQAYALRGGKQRWTIGGPAGVVADEFAGLFFLGPPLIDEGKLYCLVEDRGQIRLLVLDASTPDRPAVLWSQAILNPPPTLAIDLDEIRRTTPLTPVSLGQVLICPTGAGSVVAVDVVRQRLLWATEYESPLAGGPAWRGRPPRRRQTYEEQQRVALDKLLDAERWRHPVVLEREGRVIVPASDTDRLLCLRAADGAIEWERSRDTGLFIAGAAESCVVVIGESDVSAYRIADGEPAWDEPVRIPPPSGTGFAHQGRYTFPLATGEIATIDLVEGRLLARSPLPAGVIAGNLQAAGGRLISQSASGIAVWPTLEESPELLANDAALTAEQLALRGELRLHAGDLERGLSDLRESLQLAEADMVRTRGVLAQALIEQLRNEFEGHRDDAGEISKLVEGTPRELEFRRLHAQQLLAHGDRTAAFLELLRLGGLIEPGADLEIVDPQLSVDPARWVEAQVSELLAGSDPAEREAMYQGLRERLADVTQEPDADRALDRLKGLARMARGTPLELETCLELARRSEAEPLVRQAWLWESLVGASDSKVECEATAELAAIYLQAHDSLAAAPLIERLRTEFSDRPCLDGQTGAQLLASWEQDPQWKDALAAAAPEPWPEGKLEIREGGAEPELGRFRVIPVIGPVEGPLSGWTFTYDDTQQRLTALTPLGRFGWEAPLGNEGGPDNLVPRGVMICGSLVMVRWEDRFQIISALTPSGGRYRTITGGRSLIAEVQEPAPFRQDNLGRSRGIAGPLMPNLVCYQIGPELVGMDPWTGKDVWRRQHLSGVGEILADEDFVVVSPYGQGDLLVLRAADGAIVGRRPRPVETVTPPASASWGRLIGVMTSPDIETRVLTMYDPVTDRPAWERRCKAPVHLGAIDGGRMLLVDGRAQCVLLDPDSGRELFSLTLPVEESEAAEWESMTVLSDRERIYLALNRPQNQAMKFDRYRTEERPVNGRMYAIDRGTAQVAWSTDLAGLYIDPYVPPDWPVLILQARQQVPMMDAEAVRTVVDKETGEVLYTGRAPSPNRPQRFNQQTSWKSSSSEPVIRLQDSVGALEIRGPMAGAAP